MDEDAQLRDEISVTMEEVMETLGGGTLLIPDEVQRGLDEATNPALDADGLRTLRDDLKRLLAERQR
jgi:hypothetical protein